MFDLVTGSQYSLPSIFSDEELATDISPLLQLIFQKSLDTGVVPDDWRIANVSPVYKKGQKTLAENYRPISLTNSMSCVSQEWPFRNPCCSG
jgi:hypothetical protein